MSVDRDWRLRVQDIIEYAAAILDMTSGMDEAGFRANRTVQLAVLHCITIMGEAARHVPADIQARCPDVGWRLMNDIRNFLVHDYTGVDLGIVWRAVQNRVPPTRERLAQLLADEREAGT